MFFLLDNCNQCSLNVKNSNLLRSCQTSSLLSQYVVSLEKNLFVIINMLINYKVLKIIRKKIIIIILCVVSNYVLME